MKSRLRSCLFVFISISMLLLLSIPITSPFQYPVSVATRGICFSNRSQQRARVFNRFDSCIFKQRQKPRTGAFLCNYLVVIFFISVFVEEPLLFQSLNCPLCNVCCFVGIQLSNVNQEFLKTALQRPLHTSSTSL